MREKCARLEYTFYTISLYTFHTELPILYEILPLMHPQRRFFDLKIPKLLFFNTFREIDLLQHC